MAYFGEFVTARFQRELPERVAVSADSYLRVGQLVKLVPSDGTSLAYIQAVTANNVKEAKEAATHMIAQSDMTMEYGHVPVENRDYRYFPYVYNTFKLKGKTDAESKAAALKYVGVCDTVANLATAEPFKSAAEGSYAYVTAVNKVYKKGAANWADDSANSELTTKKVALFKLYNKDDIVVRDND